MDWFASCPCLNHLRRHSNWQLRMRPAMTFNCKWITLNFDDHDHLISVASVVAGSNTKSFDMIQLIQRNLAAAINIRQFPFFSNESHHYFVTTAWNDLAGPIKFHLGFLMDSRADPSGFLLELQSTTNTSTNGTGTSRTLPPIPVDGNTTKDSHEVMAVVAPFSGTFQTRWRGPERRGRSLLRRWRSSAVLGRLSSAGGRASARIPRYWIQKKHNSSLKGARIGILILPGFWED